jgi:hypothetical protein
MHVFTHPSHNLRQKVRVATLRNMHHTSLYKRLTHQAREQGARITATGKALHTRLWERPKEGTNILNILYGQLYNGKLAHGYGHTPTNERPLCPLPDSCTHIAGKGEAHKNLHINRHNAASHLVHAAIRNSAKGGGALYRAKDLILVIADDGTQPQTSIEDIEAFQTPTRDI